MLDKERVLDRINKLMAIAHDDAASENEVQVALSRAQSLMERYAVEQWELENSGKAHSERVTSRTIKLDYGAVNGRAGELLQIIARFNGCEGVNMWAPKPGGRRSGVRDVIIAGRDSDIDMVVALWQNLEIYRLGRWEAMAREEGVSGAARRPFKNGFYIAFNKRVLQRLRERDRPTSSTGTDIVLSKGGDARRYLEENVIAGHATVRPNSSVVSAAGLRCGRRAADNADLGGSKLGGKPVPALAR